ncbi:MAG: hypothetical protein KatS3mg102_2711 [Planctomycetota bacterium]|nr:MAG: hypothetical protein KatS3mg102_2711 [Planctomycetota bacterium]
MEKRKSRVVWTIHFDPSSRLPREIIQSVVAIARPDPIRGAPEQYYIFTTHYRLDRFGELSAPAIPLPAQQLLR